jgi:hypothetical protein
MKVTKPSLPGTGLVAEQINKSGMRVSLSDISDFTYCTCTGTVHFLLDSTCVPGNILTPFSHETQKEGPVCPCSLRRNFVNTLPLRHPMPFRYRYEGMPQVKLRLRNSHKLALFSTNGPKMQGICPLKSHSPQFLPHSLSLCDL